MATSLGRRKHQDSSFGSRFAVLDMDSEDTYPTLGARKRRANKTSENIQTNSFFNKSMKMSDLMNGPKFVVMKRIDDDETKTLKCVNPFLIQKAIVQQAGEVKSISRTQQGTILIETVSKQQAEKMYKMAMLGPNINIQVYEHPTLNTSRGVVTCYDFTFMTDDEILDGLQDQHVVAIKRFTQRVADSPTRINTQSAILTFNLPQLPEKIHIAFQSCSVRVFIPQPLRCFKCQKSGHGSLKCKSTAACGNCAGETHGQGVECENPAKCVNCGGNHPAWSRNCPNYKKEYEIQRIKTVEKVTYFEARKQYNIRYPHENAPASLANIMSSALARPQVKSVFTFPTNTTPAIENQTPKEANSLAQKKQNIKPPSKALNINEKSSSDTENHMDVTSPIKTRSRSNTRTSDQVSLQQINTISITTRPHSNTRKTPTPTMPQLPILNSSQDSIYDKT